MPAGGESQRAEGRLAASARSRQATPGRTQVPRFVLSELVFQDCLVYVELPPAAPDGLGESHRRLLLNILGALGLGRQGVVKEERFRWPLLENAFMDMGEAVARAALEDRIRQHKRQIQPACLLLFAERTLGLLLNSEQPPEALRGELREGPAGLRTLATLSLHQVLALPESKAEVWQHLQPLRRLT